MSRLLYIEASPRKLRSSSIAVAKTFLEAYGKSHPYDTIDTIDLWERELPRFDGDVIKAKYAILHGSEHTKEEARAWEAVLALINDFKNSDKYVISLPMWNFGIPYKLKHYIDVLIQPGSTFIVTPEGTYKGLVTGKPVLSIYSRGGAYGAGTGAESYDFQKDYLEHAMGFIGFTDIRSILVEPTLAGGPEGKALAVERATAEAKTLAAYF